MPSSKKFSDRGFLPWRLKSRSMVATRLGFVAPAFLAASVLLGSASARDPVTTDTAWLIELNSSALQAVCRQSLPPPVVARNLAVLHLAVEDAWLHAPADHELAALAAGATVAEALFPSWLPSAGVQTVSAQLTAPATSAAWRTGRQIAERWLASRADDESNSFVNYVPQTGAGAWRRTYPQFRPPELPNWPLVKPFAIRRAQDFVFPGPPALDSERWTRALAEMKARGGRQAPQRSADEELIARFWSDFSYTCTPPGHWNVIAAEVVRTENLSPDAAVRLFATLNTAMADAGIVCWEAKYARNFWRPITALNPSADPEGWLPLLNTPPHPEYPSGHSMFSGAAAEVLSSALGRDTCAVAVPSDALPGVIRHYTSFSAIAAEISQSRVLGGIHYPFSCADGLTVGRSVGREVLRARASSSEFSANLVQK